MTHRFSWDNNTCRLEVVPGRVSNADYRHTDAIDLIHLTPLGIRNIWIPYTLGPELAYAIAETTKEIDARIKAGPL